jgi:hypothetical protein
MTRKPPFFFVFIQYCPKNWEIAEFGKKILENFSRENKKSSQGVWDDFSQTILRINDQ